jgi:hypothetical protein
MCRPFLLGEDTFSRRGCPLRNSISCSQGRLFFRGAHFPASTGAEVASHKFRVYPPVGSRNLTLFARWRRPLRRKRPIESQLFCQLSYAPSVGICLAGQTKIRRRQILRRPTNYERWRTSAAKRPESLVTARWADNCSAAMDGRCSTVPITGASSMPSA